MQRQPLPLASEPDCVSAARPACAWHHHNYKHFPAKGVTRNDTRHGPARYLTNFNQRAIRQIETDTTLRAEAHRGAIPSKTAYLRDFESTIGWDGGKDAALSFVECSGGATGSRAFHGRPVHIENALAAALRRATMQEPR